MTERIEKLCKAIENEHNFNRLLRLRIRTNPPFVSARIQREFFRGLNVKYTVTKDELKSHSGARIRILFDGQKILAELKAADSGNPYIIFIFKNGSTSRHRHVLSDQEVDDLFEEGAGILASRISLRSLVGTQSHGI